MPLRKTSFSVRALLLLLPVCAGALVSADGTAAQTIPSPYRFIDTRQEAGLFAGANFFVGSGEYDIGPQPGPMVGARYGIFLGGPFALDGVVTYAPSTRYVKDPGESGELVSIGEADMALLTVDARLRFNFMGSRTWHRISPFFLAGGGITFDLSGDEPLDLLLLPEDRYDFGNSFSGLLGAGLRWFPTDWILVRSDLTLQLWQQDIPSGYVNYELLVRAPNEEWIQAWGVTVGAAINF